MAQDEAIEQIDIIYKEAMAELEAITERHKQEIDEYIDQLKQEKVKQLEKELKS
jgi:hypothetical protein